MLLGKRTVQAIEDGPTYSDSDISSTILAGYTDSNTASDYAKQGIAACVKNGEISGRSSDTLAPKNSITRAEVAVIVQRLLQKSELI